MYNLKNYNYNKLLTEYRKSRGLTLENLGNKIGKTKSTVSKYESGEIIPDIVTLLEICNVLDISLEQLFPLSTNNSFHHSSNNPFKSNKLYLYYYTENILITSILEISQKDNSTFVKLYNGVKNISTYASETAYYYEGTLECDKTIGYLNLYNPTSQGTQLEKLQISFIIPWSENFEITSFFILALTPNSIPIVKKGIMSINPIKDFSHYQEDLKITEEDINNLKTTNAWILENKKYDHFFFSK